VFVPRRRRRAAFFFFRRRRPLFVLLFVFAAAARAAGKVALKRISCLLVSFGLDAIKSSRGR
jgi:hypothetical protein